jgi:hypothetical protein
LKIFVQFNIRYELHNLILEDTDDHRRLHQSNKSGGKMTAMFQKKDKGRRIRIGCHLLVALFSILFLVTPCVSNAGGLYVNEFRTPSMGVPVQAPMPSPMMHPHLFTIQPA